MKKVLFSAGVAAVSGAVLVSQGCSSGGGATDAGIDGTTTDTSTGMDAPADTKKDSTGMDAGPMCPLPLVLTNWMPPAYKPPRPPTNSCMQAQIQGYWDNCRNLSTATAMKCTTWQAANMGCNACIESQRSDSAWGPLIMANGITFVNIAGCLHLQGDMTCAKLDADAAACTAAACDTPCPVTDFFAPDHGSTLMDWQKCSQTAGAGVCASWENKFAMSCPVDAGAAKACFNFMDFQSGFFLIAPMFCAAGG